MKTIVRKVLTDVNVRIFERGDLIVRRKKDYTENHYGLVLEDQNPDYPNRVKVRDIKYCDDVIWNIKDDDNWRCELVLHLEKSLD